MPEKTKTSSKIDGPQAKSTENWQESVQERAQEPRALSNTELRAGAEKLARAIIKAGASIDEVKLFMQAKLDKQDDEIEDFINYIPSIISRLLLASTYEEVAAVSQTLISEYFTNIQDIQIYVEHLPQIFDGLLKRSGAVSYIYMISFSSLLNVLREKLGRTVCARVVPAGRVNYIGAQQGDGVELTILGDAGDFVAMNAAGSVVVNGNVGMHAADGFRNGFIIIFGSTGNYLASNQSSGLVEARGSVGYSTAMGMTGGVLNMFSDVAGIHKSAFSNNNKGKIFLHHPTEGQVLIYDGSKRGLFSKHVKLKYTKEAKIYFNIVESGNEVKFLL